MNFSSHMDTVVAVAVRLVNTLTVGEARGRRYAPPSGADLPAAVTGALRGARRETRDVTPNEAAEFGMIAGALRAVFDAVAGGRLDEAAR
ncbi:MAG TPA: CGNR zinc finger domain-containing protein, partial [Streptosporangiaceae bacterium]